MESTGEQVIFQYEAIANLRAVRDAFLAGNKGVAARRWVRRV